LSNKLFILFFINFLLDQKVTPPFVGAGAKSRKYIANLHTGHSRHRHIFRPAHFCCSAATTTSQASFIIDILSSFRQNSSLKQSFIIKESFNNDKGTNDKSFKFKFHMQKSIP
jgi:hypothetical protein